MSTSAMPKKAMVLAAGLGLRMRPLTEHCPKPLLTVGGMTLLDRALDWLAASGIGEAVVNGHYLAEQIERHLAARTIPKTIFSHEESVLETGGGINNALPHFAGAPFFAVNSDVICLDRKTPALHRLWQAWGERSMDALLLVQPVAKAVGYDEVGDFFVNPDGTIRRRLQAPSAPFVFTGVQILHPRLFSGAPQGAFSLNVLYNRGMGKDGALTPRIRALAHDGEWLHVGDPQGIKTAEAFLAGR